MISGSVLRCLNQIRWGVTQSEGRVLLCGSIEISNFSVNMFGVDDPQKLQQEGDKRRSAATPKNSSQSGMSAPPGGRIAVVQGFYRLLSCHVRSRLPNITLTKALAARNPAAPQTKP
jgi:hypothetical protein